MGWIVCARCGADLGETTACCPRCGADPRSGGLPERPEPSSVHRWGLGLLCLAGAVVAGLVFVSTARETLAPAGDGVFHGICVIVSLIALLVGALAGAKSAGWSPRQDRNPLVRVCLWGFAVPALVVGLAVSTPAVLQQSSWAGYVTDGGPVKSVTATWVEPTVRSKAIGWSDVAFWVGLQGRDTDTVEQIGVLGECMDGGEADYRPWYETYPKPIVPIDEDRLLIGPGDRITATVTALGHDRYRMVLVDATTHRSFAITRTATGVGDADAAILIEAPHRAGTTMASFDPIRFTSCRVDGDPVGDFDPWVSDIVIGGDQKTDTSRLNDAGDGFSVTCRRGGR